MTRHFGIQSERLTTGANHQPPATHDDHSPRDPLLPSGSVLSSGIPFEHGEFAQTMIDVSCAGLLFLLFLVFGFAVATAFLVWFFL